MSERVKALVARKWRAFGVYGIILTLMGLAIAFLILDMRAIHEVTEGTRPTYSDALQSFVYIAAVLVGGALAVYKLQVFRDLEPHLTISHAVSHRRIGDSYWHIAVTATIQNTSKVKVEVLDRFVRLQQISPVPDEEVERLYLEVDQRDDIMEFQWPTLKGERREWVEHEFIVEPGESDQETVDFIIGAGVRSILVHTYFHNPDFQQGARNVEGWGATTMYDIVDLS